MIVAIFAWSIRSTRGFYTFPCVKKVDEQAEFIYHGIHLIQSGWFVFVFTCSFGKKA
jgi:hypothetical protein